MTIEVPPSLLPRVEAFIAEVVGKETDPAEVEACRKIALHALLQRGLVMSEDLKGLRKK
jgi:hypothetical protein